MARRSSARLRNRNSSTPNRVSLSHDAPTARTPRTVPTKLGSLQEDDEMPGTYPQSASPKSSLALIQAVPNNLIAATPTKAAPIKPAAQEMHPQLHHQTTAKPRAEARHLGFSSMAPHTEPPKYNSKLATIQGTPSKTRNLDVDAKSPSYQFTFRREHSLELSPEAKKLMHEKREEATKIREQMVAEGEQEPAIDHMLASRKIAKPKGRFSQIHLQQFEKMDSIAGHASAFRLKTGPNASASGEESQSLKSLKRSPSKAGLDNPSSTPSRPSSRDTAKPLPAPPGTQLPRSTSTKDLKSTSPAKRVKHTNRDDIFAARPSSSDGEEPLPATPSTSRLAHLTTPTQASAARSKVPASTKNSAIPAPTFTPAKAPVSILKKSSQAPKESSSALLARSPSKGSLFAKPIMGKPSTDSVGSPLLSRSPFKPSAKKPSAAEDGEASAPKSKAAPLLSRSPVKTMIAKTTSGESESAKGNIAPTPFLSRSPSKIPMASMEREPLETPGKSTANKLLGRFNLLRQSPMKSILRSPQRLYSDDPAKIAAGTHVATPPKHGFEAMEQPSGSMPPSAQKHVDFSNSTKARFEKAESSTPSKTPTPSPMMERKVALSAEPETVTYPEISDGVLLSPSPQKRRQTSGPGDFTFRAGEQNIVFGQSPNAPASATQAKRPSTIRMVSGYAPSPAPRSVVGSKKRKFEFENGKSKGSKADNDAMGTSDDGAKTPIFSPVSEKENTSAPDDENEVQEQRPAKRAKPSALNAAAKKSSASAATASSAARRTTLGVKPKGAKTTSPVKRPSTISAARLNALAQPRRRG
ncbi:Hypothetical predicted protein [Lecanosticta acicola]|uniref:Erythromycin esterase n=1 Tax=Lecanosticta acicola TaxID=111012 RepID=A0AAI8Z376_9PEZI|nr:Hypothetical predicted protein [Lecanosticta acicola]